MMRAIEHATDHGYVELLHDLVLLSVRPRLPKVCLKQWRGRASSALPNREPTQRMAASLMVASSPTISRSRLVASILALPRCHLLDDSLATKLDERPDEQRSYIGIDGCRCLQ